MNNSGIMTEEQFNEFVNSGKPCIFDFSATWCGPCRMLAPVVEDLADKYKGQYYFYKSKLQQKQSKLYHLPCPFLLSFIFSTSCCSSRNCSSLNWDFSIKLATASVEFPPK